MSAEVPTGGVCIIALINQLPKSVISAWHLEEMWMKLAYGYSCSRQDFDMQLQPLCLPKSQRRAATENS